MSDVICAICEKRVKQRATAGKNPNFKFPVYHEGLVKGQPCHGFFVQARDYNGG